ncbi:MAG TPA: hypothetical protein EYP02_02520 [Sulfurovum sp.]|nr:hypothetical protein [Sulfurovum sp.]
MNSDDVLPNFKHINTDIGLKFLNSNRKLYLKILNSFLDRYENLDIDTLDSDELNDVIHAIKGLSATLGMEELNRLSMSELTKESIEGLKESLFLVIDELRREFT